MTITLHWWLIPIVIVAFGAFYMWYDVEHSSGGFLHGAIGALGFAVSIIVALAFTLGHFLA